MAVTIDEIGGLGDSGGVGGGGIGGDGGGGRDAPMRMNKSSAPS